jgi:sugar lactone lactonase YvrE
VLQAGLPYYRAKKLIDETPLRFDLAAYKAEATPLRYPGKVLADEKSNRLFIADSNHNRIVISSLDGKLLDVIGSGEIGLADGTYTAASFNKPQGMFLRGETLYVADTENHMLRKVDLKAKQVQTIAGVGTQARNAWPGLEKISRRDLDRATLPDRWVGIPGETALNSPWDLWVHGTDLYIAMAGPHQIWKMPLDEKEIGPYAGNGREDIVDGPLLPKEPYALGYSSFAQPSGLTSDGEVLYVADSEGSSIRAVPFDPTKPATTPLGTSQLPSGRLFDFGDVDGDSSIAKFQHLLGVAWYEGKLYVADTYNNKIKVVDVKKQRSDTLVGNGKPGKKDAPAEFDEPAGISAAAGKLYVADTNNHLIRVVDLKQANKVTTLTIAGLEPPKIVEPATPDVLSGSKEVAVEPTALKAVDGQISLNVALALPAGWKMNPLAPMRYTVTADGAGVVKRDAIGKSVKLDEPAAKFAFKVPVSQNTGADTIKVSLNYYYCEDSAEGVCKTGSVTWTVPLKLAEGESRTAVDLTFKVE